MGLAAGPLATARRFATADPFGTARRVATADPFGTARRFAAGMGLAGPGNGVLSPQDAGLRIRCRKCSSQSNMILPRSARTGDIGPCRPV
jgi:hypothetical protein